MAEDEIKGENIKEEQETKPEEGAPIDGIEEGKPLEKMTVPELREIAKEIPGVTGVHAMKKDEVLALIKEYRGIKEDRPLKEKKVTKSGFSVAELKAKRAALRREKDLAMQESNDKKLKILRRRMNRLRKQSRKAAKAAAQS